VGQIRKFLIFKGLDQNFSPLIAAMGGAKPSAVRLDHAFTD
jgi:hypothetical protein